jgi:hypothetical protein
MPLARFDAPFDHPDWIFEPKMDGFRAVAYVEGGACRLVSRNRNAFKTFEPLAQAIAQDLRPDSHPGRRDPDHELGDRGAASASSGSTCRPRMFRLVAVGRWRPKNTDHTYSSDSFAPGPISPATVLATYCFNNRRIQSGADRTPLFLSGAVRFHRPTTLVQVPKLPEE